MDNIEKIEKLEQITREHSKDFEIIILYPINTLDIIRNGNPFAFSLITSGNRKNRIRIKDQEDYDLAEKLKQDYRTKFPELGEWEVKYEPVEYLDKGDFEAYLFNLN